MFRDLFEGKYTLIDFEDEEVTQFEYHGNTHYVVDTLKSSIIAEDPEGEEVEISLKDITKQDDTVNKITKS